MDIRRNRLQMKANALRAVMLILGMKLSSVKQVLIENNMSLVGVILLSILSMALIYALGVLMLSM
jgi:hypothetical protein